MLTLTATIVGVVGVSPALATWTPGAPSNPGDVTPTVVGSGTCSSVGSVGTQFKISKLYVDKTYVINGGPTIMIDASPDKKSFSWTISSGFQVHDVTVLGLFTPFNHYDYGETPRVSDGNLHAPLIGTSSTFLALGYFCWSPVEAPPADGSITGKKYNDTNANGQFDGSDEPLSNWAIHLIGPGEHESPIFTDESGSYAFEDLGPGSYTVCEAAGGAESDWQQSGPLGPENDVCQGEGFPAGLAAGGYQVVLEEGATVDTRDFFNFVGVSLDCGDETSVGGEGDAASGSFTRVDNGTCDDGDTKGVLTDVETVEGEEIIAFIPHGFGDSNYSGTLTFFKNSGDPNLLVLQYDPGDGFREMPACGDADIVDGLVISAFIPEGHNWCFASVGAEPVGDGQWQVDWLVFGLDDPRFK